MRVHRSCSRLCSTAISQPMNATMILQQDILDALSKSVGQGLKMPGHLCEDPLRSRALLHESVRTLYWAFLARCCCPWLPLPSRETGIDLRCTTAESIRHRYEGASSAVTSTSVSFCSPKPAEDCPASADSNPRQLTLVDLVIRSLSG